MDLSIHRQKDAVILLLRDLGPGIAQGLRERVFLPFVWTNPAIEGSGLGLTIAKEVVLNHGATLLLEDPPEGSGLQVRVSFSLGHPAQPEGQPNQV